MTLIWEIFCFGLYLQNPYWPSLMGSLVYYANWNLPIHAAVAFPISLTWIVRSIQQGQYPDHRKLLDLEVTRWILIIILNFIEVAPNVFRVGLGSHCSNIVLMQILQQFNCKYIQYYISGFNIIWVIFANYLFWPNFTYICLVWILLGLNSLVHLELAAVKTD